MATLAEAIKEAYASAPAGEVIVQTLELRHSTFSAPIRIVADYEDQDFRLEDGAPVNEGEMVTFTAYAFDFQEPPISDSPASDALIRVDNVDRAILDQISAATETLEPIELTYRPYLLSDREGPQYDPPMHLILTSVSATVFEIQARARFQQFVNVSFPPLEYTVERFPSLVF